MFDQGVLLGFASLSSARFLSVFFPPYLIPLSIKLVCDSKSANGVGDRLLQSILRGTAHPSLSPKPRTMVSPR